MLGVGACRHLAAQQITAVGIAKRQRFATAAVASQEPALEVDAPDVVGSPTMRKRCARGRAAPPQLPPDCQPFAIEQSADCAYCRPILGRMAPFQIGADLQRPPARMRPPHRKALLENMLRDRVRMVMRRARAVRQALDAFILIAFEPFVSGLPARTEPPANRCKQLLPLLDRHYKTHPLFHGTGSSKSHRQGPPCRSVDLLPMSSVCSVTHVVGQDRQQALSRKGRGRHQQALRSWLALGSRLSPLHLTLPSPPAAATAADGRRCA